MKFTLFSFAALAAGALTIPLVDNPDGPAPKNIPVVSSLPNQGFERTLSVPVVGGVKGVIGNLPAVSDTDKEVADILVKRVVVKSVGSVTELVGRVNTLFGKVTSILSNIGVF